MQLYLPCFLSEVRIGCIELAMSSQNFAHSQGLFIVGYAKLLAIMDGFHYGFNN